MALEDFHPIINKKEKHLPKNIFAYDLCDQIRMP